MSDVGAGDDLERAAAHPRLEAELEVLAAPDVETVVVGPEPVEELLVDAEQSPGHGGRGHGLRRVRVLLLLVVGDGVPVELQKNILNTVKIFTPN